MNNSQAAGVGSAGLAFDPLELSLTSEWREIGDGGYSTVFAADWLGTRVAIKRTADKKITAKLAMLRELRLFRLAGAHPNLVQLLGVFEESNRLHCVLEYVPYTLRSTDVIVAVDPITVVADIARALVHIHRRGIVHRDIKARNILVTSASRSGRARLIDFGLACSLEHDAHEWLHRSVGTKSYRPPEMKSRSRAAGSQDIFSLGVMVLKLCRRLPKQLTPQENAALRLLSRLGADCLQKEPTERPDAITLLRQLQDHIRRPLEPYPDDATPRNAISEEQELMLEREEQAREDLRSAQKDKPQTARSTAGSQAEGDTDVVVVKRSRPDSQDEERSYETRADTRHIKSQ